jgi:SPP1 family predicted phage head-tail adaptor
MRPFKYTPKLSSGQFRSRITFQKKEGYYDDLGQYREGEWSDYESAWCMIKTIKGREYFEAAMSQSEKVYRFVVRYQNGVTSDMRIKYNGRIFDITEPPINDDELNETLTIIAKETGVSNG